MENHELDRTKVRSNREDSERLINVLFFVISLLLLIVLVLLFFTIKGSVDYANLIIDVIPDIVASLIVSITIAAFFFVIQKKKARRNNLEPLMEQISVSLDEIKNPVKYEYSGEDVYSLIFQSYLDSKDNCLDYIAIASTEKIIDQAINKNLKKRMKGNNERNLDSNEKLKEYREFLSENNDELKNITESLSKISQGALHKIICDVKVGGIIYEIFNDPKDGEIYYLFAATVDQDSIDTGAAYSEIETIFDEIKDKVQREFGINIINHKN